VSTVDGTRVLWITGAGSGMGQATAVAAAARGARVVLSGRRRDALDETAQLVEHVGGQSLVLPLDAREVDAAGAAHHVIASSWGGVTDLILAAGLNTRERYWRNQSLETFTDIIATNLTGVARIVDAVLPDLRTHGSGQVVVISSYAAWRYSPHSGVAYMASKSALATICASLNTQEAEHGIRACHLCPGDVNTEFLAMRPQAPDAEARKVMLSPDDVAAAVMFVLESPPHVRIDELVISPLAQH
jgi:NADP-dependent 3-hydroxy acid dehydrogenase YdfG